jgi:hypothetical protein
MYPWLSSNSLLVKAGLKLLILLSQPPK